MSKSGEIGPKAVFQLSKGSFPAFHDLISSFPKAFSSLSRPGRRLSKGMALIFPQASPHKNTTPSQEAYCDALAGGALFKRAKRYLQPSKSSKAQRRCLKDATAMPRCLCHQSFFLLLRTRRITTRRMTATARIAKLAATFE